MHRTLESRIKDDLDSKIVLLTGPRQTGKTTLSKKLYPENHTYLNFDSTQDRMTIQKESWPRSSELLILDEIHKKKNWKRWIKGVFDTQGVRPRLLLTGSARMDVFRKGGDSLAGRHFLFRLHPFSVSEVLQSKELLDPKEALDRIMAHGGFPEPFLKADPEFTDRWRRSHLERILREDLLDLEKVRDIKAIEILIDLLANRVGSTVSYSSLARDLEVSPKTVKSWIAVLERLYVVFVVPPYSKNLARAYLKEPKIYFFDTGRVADNPGARLENAVACALLKRNQYLEDVHGKALELYYIRDHQKREVDFLTTQAGKPEYLIEVKLSDGTPAPSLRYYAERVQGAKPIQLVKNLPRREQHGDILIEDCAQWLAKLEG